MNPQQIELFAHVAEAYAASPNGRLDNHALYAEVARRAGIDDKDMATRVPIGRAGHARSPITRQIRWKQQDLKKLNLIEKVDGKRGLWQLTDAGEKKLLKARPDVALLAFSTDLGIAIWGSCQRVFPALGLPITLCVTSPPYPLSRPRAYGNPSISEYVDFILRTLDPIVRDLVPGGTIALNISNDIYVPGSPARSTYLERLVIALEDKLSLHLLDRLVWYNPCRPPGTVKWTSLARVQLNQSWEPVLVLTNNPHQARANNTRVLEPHTEAQNKLIAAGGEQRAQSYADGAHRVRYGSYANQTAGRIPRNVLIHSHNCQDHRGYRKDADALNLPSHGAVMPLSLATFLIRYLSEPGELVVDPFGGSLKTARAAEDLGRAWIVTEWILDYVRAAAERFRSDRGFQLNSALSVIS